LPTLLRGDRSVETKPGRRRISGWVFALALFLALLAWIMSPRPSRAEARSNEARTDVIDRIAAVVNNEVITEYDLTSAVSSLSRAPGKDVKTRQEVLDNLIDAMLFNQIMSKAKVEVTDDDVARAIANVLHQNRMTLDQLRAELASKGISYEQYKKDIENEIRRVKFTNQVIGPQVKISDQDLRDYYQKNQQNFRGGSSAHIAQIVMPFDDIATETDAKAAGGLAMEIVKKARRGASFDSLVKGYSKGPYPVQGGDLGMVEIKELQPEVAEIVRSLKPGEVSNPAIIGNSLVVVKLVSLPEIAPDDFEKMRDRIYEALYEQKIDETLRSYLQRERSKAFIEIR